MEGLIYIDGWVVPPDLAHELRQLEGEGPWLDAFIWHEWARDHLVYYRKLSVGDVRRLTVEYAANLGASKVEQRLVGLSIRFSHPWFTKVHPIPISKPQWRHYLENADEF